MFNLNEYYTLEIFQLFMEDLFFLKEYRDMCNFINRGDRQVLRELTISTNRWTYILDEHQDVKMAFEKWICRNFENIRNRIQGS